MLLMLSNFQLYSFHYLPIETFQELYSQIKESKVRYRFPLESCKNLVVFSKNSIRNYQTLYKFI